MTLNSDAATLAPASAAAEHLGAALGLAVEAAVPHDGSDPDSLLLPGDDAVGFTFQLRPAAAHDDRPPCGRLVVAISESDAAIHASQGGAGPMLDAAVAGALEALEHEFGAMRATPGVEGDAASALASVVSSSGMDRPLVIVPLLEGDRHAATIAVSIERDVPVAVDLPTLSTTAPEPGPSRQLASLSDVEMTVSVRLGETRLVVRDLLQLQPGAVIALDHSASQPVDVFVNGTLIARGEVVVVDEDYGVQITELVARG